MMLAIRALAWEILARHRWLVGGSVAWLVAACVVAALLPGGGGRVPNVGGVLLSPTLLGAIAFLMAVTHGQQTRLDTRAGEFPRRLLLLPVSAGLLAGVPLTLALGVPSLAWTVAAVGVLRPYGGEVAVFWPGLYLGVVLAWLLALCWSPMPLRWARMAFICVMMASFVAGALLLQAIALPEYAIVLGLGVLAGPAVGLAVRGVSRSRCEGGDDTEAAANPMPRGERVPIEVFRSRLRAQLWLEWRTHGRPLAILTFLLGILLLPAVATSEHVLRTDPFLYEVITRESLPRVGPAWISLAWLLFVGAILAGAGGGEMGRFAQGQKSMSVPAFVGLLPLPTVDLVKGKFIATAIHLALMWGFLLAMALGWAVLGGHVGDMADRLRAVSGSPALAWLTFFAVLLSAYLISFLICVGSMWGGLSGSPMLGLLPPFLGVLLIGLAIWFVRHWPPSDELTLPGLWIALLVKALLAASLVRYGRKRFHVSGRHLAAALLAWAALTAVPACTAAWLVGDPTAALAVVVLSPLVSCLATPAILHRSRHGAWA